MYAYYAPGFPRYRRSCDEVGAEAQERGYRGENERALKRPVRGFADAVEQGEGWGESIG